MEKNKLMRKKKTELLAMLKKLGVKADKSALKQELVDLILAHGKSSKSNRRKNVTEKGAEKQARPRAGRKRREGAAVTIGPEAEETGETEYPQEKVEETKYSTEIEFPDESLAETPAMTSARMEYEKEEGAGPSYPRELPRSYHDDRISAIVRDPYWIFVYWEVRPETVRQAQARLGGADNGAKMILRIYDISGINFTGENANFYFDIEVGDGADNWYINTGRPNTEYCVDIGLVSRRGEYHTLARSNPVHTPRAGMSEELDESWMGLEEEFERMYALSGGLETGHGSLELGEMMEKQLRLQLASEAAASLFSMAAIPKKERGFRLNVNTELIIYGATEPDASLTIQGTPVKLRPDGTFQVRFALPDGQQIIPVTARSADGAEERTITPIVSRVTSVMKSGRFLKAKNR